MNELVIFVEDDRDIRDTVVELLQLEGYRSMAYENGLEAWKVLQSGLIPDLIITDVMMPVMDGFELIERISTMPSLALVPIVCATASITVTMRLGNACKCIRKPFDLGELTSLLRDVVKRR